LPEEKRAARRAFTLDQDRRARPFGAQSVHLGKPLLEKHRAAVGTHAPLRKPRDLLRQGFRRRAAFAVWHDALAQTNAVAFLRRHLASREDEVERGAAPDNPREPHGAAVDQRHAPAPAINAHVSALFHHAQIAPQRELHAARDRRPGDGRDHRFR
jgi:hypothetical protein